MQTEVKKVSRFKSKVFWLKTVGILVTLSIFYNIGASGATVKLEDEKVNYDELVSTIKDKEKEVKEKEKEIEEIQSELENVNSEYTAIEKEYSEAKKIVENKKSLVNEVAELTMRIDSKNNEVTKLDESIKAKSTELASITGQVKEKAEEPKVLTAGFFTVGKDIPEGRYKVVPSRGSGNFFVNGGASVNIMLGKGEFYEEEYVFTAYEGDEIELTLSAKFIPVE